VTRYRYLPAAREDLNEAAAFYEASVPGLGDAFLDDVERELRAKRSPDGSNCACEAAAQQRRWPAAQQDR
jgi:hypothetical protein